MKKYIKTVTVTGASDDTSFEDMLNIQKEYPFVEWGILLSRRMAGNSNRFPSKDWLERLQEFGKTSSEVPLNLSAHFCGSLVNDFLNSELTKDIAQILDSKMYSRVQINTHGERTKYDLNHLIKNISHNTDIQFIAQFDKVNDYIFELREREYSNIAALYDLSHGAGVLPTEWDEPLFGIYTGYAGGLSPENLENQLLNLDSVVEEPIWIDAETWLRTNDLFDLDKVVEFLKIAKTRIID